MKKAQTSCFQDWKEKETVTTSHGGETAKGRRKTRRPLDSRKSLHLVIRSSKATGELNLLRPRNRKIVDEVVKKQSARFGIRIERFANVGNHCHFMLRFRGREYFPNFLRTVTTLISRKVTGARKGGAFGRFWDALAFSRVVTSKYAEQVLRSFIQGNIVEAKYGAMIRSEYLLLEARKRRRRWRDRDLI